MFKLFFSLVFSHHFNKQKKKYKKSHFVGGPMIPRHCPSSMRGSRKFFRGSPILITFFFFSFFFFFFINLRG